MFKIFIDGGAGTTGLKIFDRLQTRKDVELITLSDQLRKDVNARKDAINSADVVFLCLPDDASREAVSLIENPSVKVIDTSTAFRTNDDWAYGFAELGFEKAIANSKRVANPGCHASGFLALIKPLIDCNLLSPNAKLSCFSITGYTGGGKKMIAEYQSESISEPLLAPRQYGLTQKHKHLPEMTKIAGLCSAPLFCPIVSSYACGMEVTVPLFASDLNGSVDLVKQAYKDLYNGEIVKYTEENEQGFLTANAFSGKDGMQISVFGNEERILLVSRFDNLGKGASGAAIQNLNILLGVDQTTGLIL